MAAGPSTPPAEEPARASERSGEAPPDGAGAAGARPVSEERYGPLTLLRTRKDDGRSLILYSRAEHERSDAETPPAERPPAAGEPGRGK